MRNDKLFDMIFKKHKKLRTSHGRPTLTDLSKRMYLNPQYFKEYRSKMAPEKILASCIYGLHVINKSEQEGRLDLYNDRKINRQFYTQCISAICKSICNKPMTALYIPEDLYAYEQGNILVDTAEDLMLDGEIKTYTAFDRFLGTPTWMVYNKDKGRVDPVHRLIRLYQICQEREGIERWDEYKPRVWYVILSRLRSEFRYCENMHASIKKEYKHQIDGTESSKPIKPIKSSTNKQGGFGLL